MGGAMGQLFQTHNDVGGVTGGFLEHGTPTTRNAPKWPTNDEWEKQNSW